MRSASTARYLSIASILILMTLLAPAIGLSDEREVELEPITITLKPFQGEYEVYTKDISSILPDEEPGITIEEMLDYESGLDISRRGILGIQSDLSIRGATNEQTIVSINGIVLNDPQTAHHNLDLAIPQAGISEIRIVRGTSPNIWAQAAIGGAVNIVTRKPTKTEGDISYLVGTDTTQKGSLYVAYSKDCAGVNFSAEEATSNGWRFDTDFKEFALSSSALFKVGDKIASYFFAGYGEKEFGAANFYGLYDSKEWTDTLFLNWDTTIEIEYFKMIPKLYFRRHHDKYMLDINRPNYYLNHHKTDIEGIQLEAEADLGYGLFLAGVDFKREVINSTGLGKDSQNKNSYSLSWKNYRHPFFGYDASIRINDYSGYETEILPQGGAFLMLGPNLKLRSSISRSTRPPTYTELLYDSPSNKGDKNLSPEKAINYEAGFDMTFGDNGEIRLSATAFRRDASDLIDWVKEIPTQSFYQAKNITEVKTEGVETEARFKCVKWLDIIGSYSYIDSDIKKGEDYISKYALNHPDHKVAAEADIILAFGRQTIRLLYKDRKGYGNYLIMGCDLNYRLNKYGSLFTTVDNLLNSTYWDIKDNSLPGREIRAGAKVEF